jgi:exopolysaccharide biosynthesis polyprenyl glycosylphosphotransferase
LIDGVDRMGLPHAVSSSPELRSFAPPRRLPLGGIVPLSDGLALVAATLGPARRSPAVLLYGLLAYATLRVGGSYRARINPRLSDDIGGLVGRMAIPLLLIGPFVGSNQLTSLARAAPVAAGLIIASRAIAYRIVREARARGLVIDPTLIVGAGKFGVQVASTLREHPEFGLLPIGFLDSYDDEGLPIPILGDVRELEPIIRDFGVRRVIVAFGSAREPEMVRIIRACDRLPVEVHVVPRFFELGVVPEGPRVDDLWGLPLMRLQRSALRSMAWRTKRVFDIVVASALLFVAAPIFGICAIAVLFSGPGPIFFRQKRIGQRGEIFELLKFRTMPMQADADTRWSVAGDERMTWVGKVLRRSSIDELPQLINVVKGEMSLVGPRPERPFFVDQFRVAVPEYEDRHRVPTGMTGWAQVHGLRGDTSIPQRARFDNYYVEHWSLWTDLVILVRTVGAVFSGSGR